MTAGAEMRVLLVDDDRVDRIAVRRLLGRDADSPAVTEAAGVLEAIDRLSQEHFDCVLLDFNLPDGDGLTFLRGMRNAGLAVPVVMLTGQSDPEVIAHLLAAGAAAYLPKDSLSSERLLSTLHSAASNP